MIYISGKDIYRAIKYALEIIDRNISHEEPGVVYLNGSLPNQLQNAIKDMQLKFKTNEVFMKGFTYHKVNSLDELLTLIKSLNKDSVIVLESLDLIFSSPGSDYVEANSLMVRILLEMKNHKAAFVLNSSSNVNMELYFDRVVRL